MGDPFADAHSWVFQCNGRDIEMLKQADTFAKHKRDQVDVDFVEQSSVQALLRNRCGSYRDRFVTCNRFCLLNSAFKSIGDERHRPVLLDPFRCGPMSHDNDRNTYGMVASPSMC